MLRVMSPFLSCVETIHCKKSFRAEPKVFTAGAIAAHMPLSLGSAAPLGHELLGKKLCIGFAPCLARRLPRRPCLWMHALGIGCCLCGRAHPLTG